MTDKKLKKSSSKRTIAAVDLGSNSFHMIVARIEEDGSLKVIDRIKEMVRLGAGLDENNILDEETQERALDCLSRFAQRLQNIKKKDIRIAATNTLRIATNANAFIKRARKVIDHRIDIISGVEEARLVYHGAVYSLAELGSKRLVVDIGGGSTEVIIGENTKPVKLESLHFGSSSITKQYFSDGVITKARIKKADIHVLQDIEDIRQAYIKTGWEQSVGTSGTIRSISKILLSMGLTDGTITDKGLKNLLAMTENAGAIDKIKLDGLSSDRKPVFIGGLIILNALFKALNIKELTASDGALREGLMVDLVGRIKHQDIRELSVGQMAERYAVRFNHAENIRKTCEYLFTGIETSWKLNDENLLQLVYWAAQLHETGLAISHSGYHKHSAYLVLNSDMPGFSMQEQQLLSLLLRYHRKNILANEFDSFSEKYRKKIFKMLVILRLAIIFNRSLIEDHTPVYKIEAKNKTIRLLFPKNWFDENPLTTADLESEADYLESIGYQLQLKKLK